MGGRQKNEKERELSETSDMNKCMFYKEACKGEGATWQIDGRGILETEKPVRDWNLAWWNVGLRDRGGWDGSLVWGCIGRGGD